MGISRSAFMKMKLKVADLSRLPKCILFARYKMKYEMKLETVHILLNGSKNDEQKVSSWFQENCAQISKLLESKSRLPWGKNKLTTHNNNLLAKKQTFMNKRYG